MVNKMNTGSGVVPEGHGCREQSQQAVSALSGFHPDANSNSRLLHR
ncbi:hypothetical protein HMPREF1144_0357 [Klebsiella sp. OBRC7]|nr:hypothetical protein HMPREF1144_0357 [Klebsiella sp. OBRC7]